MGVRALNAISLQLIAGNREGINKINNQRLRRAVSVNVGARSTGRLLMGAMNILLISFWILPW